MDSYAVRQACNSGKTSGRNIHHRLRDRSSRILVERKAAWRLRDARPAGTLTASQPLCERCNRQSFFSRPGLGHVRFPFLVAQVFGKLRRVLAGAGVLLALGFAGPTWGAVGPIVDFQGGTVSDYLGAPLSGSGYSAQLWGGATSDPTLMTSLTSVTGFSGAQPGYVVPVSGFLPVPAGSTVYLQVRAWDNKGGTILSYAAAVADGATRYGAGSVVAVVTPTGGPPPPLVLPPPNYFGLFGFSISYPPTISGIANQRISRDTITPAIPFTVTDAQTPVNSLVLSALSSNPNLVPNANILFVIGPGANTSLVATPVAGQSGHTTITVTVTDLQGKSAMTSFVLSVSYIASPAAADGAAGSLRQLIITANADPGPDFIELPGGTYNLTLFGPNEDAAATGDLDITDDLVISGAGPNPTNSTIIDASTLGDRVFQVIGPNVIVTLSGLTIQGGAAPGASSGGGIASNGHLTVQQCVVQNCSASGSAGGGIFSSGPLTLNKTTVSSNVAQAAGGVYATDNSQVLTDCSIINNNATSYVGGISVTNSVAILVRTRISGNTSGIAGGIQVVPGSLVMDSCEVSLNSAAQVGGLQSFAATITLTNCTFSGNTSTAALGNTDASALYSIGGTVNALNCTFAFNTLPSASLGGGIIACNSVFTARNTIFAGNTVQASEVDFYQGLVSAGHNLLQSISGTTITGDTTGNITGDDPLLGPLQNNGGPTLTHALLAGSPAINAGDNTGVPATDQRGLPRIFGGTVDMGAFEAQPTLVVDNTSDSGPGSLRQAILDANATVGVQETIIFNIPGAGVQTIQPIAALPAITDPVIIDGYTQPGSSVNTLANGDNAILQIELDGSLTTTSVGLSISAGNTTVRGLVINRFASRGISMDTQGGNTIQGNFIGTDATGTTALGNGSALGPAGHGILISGTANNTIGGATPDQRNIISANAGDGIDLAGDSNLVQGNFIGTDRTGTAALGNGTLGIDIGGNSNTIGGITPQAGNVISANLQYGVGSGGTANLVQGNYIGTDATGTVALGNAIAGLIIQGANHTIGGIPAGAGNLISGNGIGIEILGATTTGITVQGNLIGLQANGNASLGNLGRGIVLQDAYDNLIGGSAGAGGNTISGNGDSAVALFGVTATGNTVQGNYIGTTVTGSAALPNNNGVRLSLGANNNTVGGTAATAGNVISGNSGNGVTVDSSGTTGNLILGNYIGTIPSGAVALPNGLNGVEIDVAANNTVGNSSAGNVISGNDGDGVLVSGVGASGNTIQNNYIGLGAFGAPAVPNSANGVHVTGGASGTQIGGGILGQGNFISGNTGDAVHIDGLATTGNILLGNEIGILGPGGLGNNGNGVFIQANNNTVGGTGANDGNEIGLNLAGVVLATGASGNVVQGNSIGTTPGGIHALGNRAQGVLFAGAGNQNTIGGLAAGAGNLIANNAAAGVYLDATTGTGNAIQRNLMFRNSGLMIDIDPPGQNPNDPGDPDLGPNQRQNWPEIAAVDMSGGLLTLTYLVDSTTANAVYPLSVEFYKLNNTLDGPALIYTDVYTSAQAQMQKTISIPVTLTGTEMIFAIDTDAAGNTSESSPAAFFNNAPVLNTSITPVLAAELEDSGAPSGAVGTLISSLVQIGGVLGNVSDIDPGALTGVAVTAADTAHGGWYYSTDGGTTWNPLGAVADASARLLAADAFTRIYYQPIPNFNGTIPGSIAFRAWDQTLGANGGTADATANGGFTAFSTATDTVDLTIIFVNDAPSFVKGPDQTVPQGAGPQTVVSWATAISAGPPEEASQSVNFVVTGDSNPGLFSVAPAVDPSGTLTYTPLPGASGSAIITLVIHDNGGTANGGIDTSAPQMFTINVLPSVCPGNLNWPLACTLNLTANQNLLHGQVFQSLDNLDETRWYNFAVAPGSQLIVTLTDLPANYDLFLFQDIAANYLELAGPTTTTLAQLGAEFSPTAFSPTAFSPTAFSPTAFSPTAFSPTAFSPTAFSPTAFSPTAFSPTAFSPTAFSPTAFSPTAFSPTAFSPTAFSPTAFSPTAFSPTAFSAAQTRSLVGVSAFPGLAGEGILVNTWENSGNYYVCVRGQNGAFAPGQQYRLDVFESIGSCPALTPPPPLASAAAGNFQTIIITDVGRMNPSHDPVVAQQIATMQQKLSAFATRPEVAGVVVDMGGVPSVVNANSIADQNVGCTFVKNIVAQAIKNVITSYEAQNPLEYVVLVGNDSVIPFFRHPDLAGLANEMDYYPPVLDNTSSQAALRLGEVLSQDDYGSICGLSINGSTFPIPDLAVGRLVEEPAEISGGLDAYPAASGGVIPTPASAFVSGYDFMLSAAVAISNEFRLGIGTGAGTLNEGLLAVNAAGMPLSPQDPNAWTAVNLRNKLVNTRHDLIFLGAHFSEGEALAADWTTIMTSAELAASTANLVNAIVLGAGCHVGYNTVDAHAIPDVTLDPDWAQTFALKQVGAFIGGTGYQYGDTDFIAYNDLLYLDLAQQLRAGTGPVSVGKALMAAKRQYLSNTPVPRGIHEKAVLQTTLFGLPMLSVNLPFGRGSATGVPPIVTPPLASFATAPGAPAPVGLGLQYADVTITTAPLNVNTVTLAVYPVPPLPTPPTVAATYLSASGGQLSDPGEPVLPLIVENATVPNTVLRGVVFRTGHYADQQNVRPLTGAPATEIRGVSVPFQTPVFYPIQPWSVNYYDGLCNAAGGNTRLMLFPAQYETSTPGSDVGTRRTFSDMSFRLYYSANTQTYTGANNVPSTPSLADPPSISGVTANVAGSQVTFQAHVVGNPAAGIQEVWVTYTAVSGAWNGQWQSINLIQQVQPVVSAEQEDSTLWVGSLTLPSGSSAQDVRYFLQAVNGVGLVTLDTQQGAFYTPGAPAPQPTTLTFGSFPLQGAYGATVTLNAALSDSSTSTPIGGQPVIFGLGSQKLLGTTAAVNGQATIGMQLLSTPGTYLLQATFPGTDTRALSSATAVYTVNPQATRIVLAQTGPQNNLNLTATLTDVLGQPLAEKTLFFVVADSAGSQVLYATPKQTDFAGRAVLGSIPLNPGPYTVIAYFGGIIPLSGSVATPATSTQVTDEDYLPTSAQLSIQPQAQACTVAYTGGTTASVGGTLHMSAQVTAPAGSDVTLALVQFLILDAYGNPVPDTKIVAPVDNDGTSLASIGGLGTAVYQVQVQVVGSAFTSPASTAQIAVYDPQAGYVVGAGSINSPVGAYAAKPSLSGPASFALYSRYLPQTKVPLVSGTAFAFQAANLGFLSLTGEWLVVSGTKAQYKGTGTVNLKGNFGFIVTAIDGQLPGGGGYDKLRLKIWDKNNGNKIVYDTQPGAPDSADPTSLVLDNGKGITIVK